jgi:tellurite resistance protein TerC
VIHRFYLLKVGLSIVLTFVGVKMLLASVFDIPIFISLLVIALILGASVVGSLIFPREKNVA